jgi:putative transposase
MPRKAIPPSDSSPYHVTARGLNREPFPISLHDTWALMEDYLYLTAHLYNLQIHCFVLMPNHFHLLVSTPEANIGSAMNYFMRETARETSRLSGRINQTFGARHHKTVVHNPNVEDYAYSTIQGLLGLNQLIIPVAEDTILFPDRFDRTVLEWLNSKPKEGAEDEIRQALKHSIFSFNTSRKTGKPSLLERQLL